LNESVNVFKATEIRQLIGEILNAEPRSPLDNDAVADAALAKAAEVVADQGVRRGTESIATKAQVYRRIREKAEALRTADPHITIEQAVARVVSEALDLAEGYTRAVSAPPVQPPVRRRTSTPVESMAAQIAKRAAEAGMELDRFLQTPEGRSLAEAYQAVRA
jgi:hypothetical protein